MSVKVQVIFYSMYGHIYKMAQAVAEGAKQVPGAEVSIYQVAETTSRRSAGKNGRQGRHASFAQCADRDVDKLAEADAIIFGTPTRFGNMAAQMRNSSTATGSLVGQRRADRESRQRFRFDWHTARRPGNHHHQLSHHACYITAW